jgi:phosphoribosylaminoimidazolecarboxamide formyltransferase/IMP cyclohydrolase
MIKRALISVSDKSGVAWFAKYLHELGVEILSTGGTKHILEQEGISCISVDDYTGSPEIMGGRVKTLHPKVHGGILYRPKTDDDDLEKINAHQIDMVVVNLYPFEKTVRLYEDFDLSIENIDIGGPTLLRSAAKNHKYVTAICDPDDYIKIADELYYNRKISYETKRQLATKVFTHTACYDSFISTYMTEDKYPDDLLIHLKKKSNLRYGENSHQEGVWYESKVAGEISTSNGTLSDVGIMDLGKKQLSFNNIVDLDAVMMAVAEHEEPAAVVVKHTNPCGLATADTLSKAYEMARLGDPESAFGGVVALNRAVDLDTAKLISKTFIEAVLAPGFDDDALKKLRKKKNMRLIKVNAESFNFGGKFHFKQVSGGFVVQDYDFKSQNELIDPKIVTKRAPTSSELDTLNFAWKVCKHVKSNAIVLANNDTQCMHVVGVGAGQMSRVKSVEIAISRAKDRVGNSVLASDGFFPFPDGVEMAIDSGVTAIVQPGGSIRDEEVIAAADKAGIAMIFTGKRHFRH